MTTLGFVFVAQALLGLGHHKAAVDCCDACGVERGEVAAQLDILQHSPRWRERERAAHQLRKYNWRCHPDVVGALAFSLLNDCEDEVREEAAQSLTKMGACLPAAHEALSRAAASDPDFCTRHSAKHGLKKLGKHCIAPCTVCSPSTLVQVIGPAAGAPIIVAPGEAPTAIPAPLPGSKTLPPSSFPRADAFPPPDDPRNDPLPPVDSRVEPAPEAEPGPPIEGPALPGAEPLPAPIPTSRADRPREPVKRPRERLRFARFLFRSPDRLSRADD